MKRTTQILTLIIILTSCQTDKKDNFVTFIGQEKAQVIAKAITHFNDFLMENFEGKNDYEKTLNFLTYLDTTSKFKLNWTLDLNTAKDIISTYESSGLRNDFKLYGFEKYDSIFVYDIERDTFPITDTSYLETIKIDLEEEELIPIDGSDTESIKARIAEIDLESQRRWDSTLHYNIYGRYQFELKKYYRDDSTVYNY